LKILATAIVSILFCVAATADDTKMSDLANNIIFQKNCAKCHGKTGGGRHFAGPSLRSGKAADAPPDELRAIITNGKGRMPKFAGKLDAGDINRLVEQIKAAKK